MYVKGFLVLAFPNFHLYETMIPVVVNIGGEHETLIAYFVRVLLDTRGSLDRAMSAVVLDDVDGKGCGETAVMRASVKSYAVGEVGVQLGDSHTRAPLLCAQVGEVRVQLRDFSVAQRQNAPSCDLRHKLQLLVTQSLTDQI